MSAENDFAGSVLERISQLVESKTSGNWRRYAIEAGLNPSTLQRAKNGSSVPTGETLLRIAKCAGVSVDWLLTGETPEGISPEETELVEAWRHLPEDKKGTVRDLIGWAIPNVATCIEDEETGTTYEVLAFRELTRDEVLNEIRDVEKSRKGNRREKTVRIVTTIR
jgi:transcriptional regulator with XRE-family HTH domain